MRIVPVELEGVPFARTSVWSPVVCRYGSPLIVTFMDLQALYSVREVVVNVLDGPAGRLEPNVSVIVPPSGHGMVKPFSGSPLVGARIATWLIAWLTAELTANSAVAVVVIVATADGDDVAAPHPVASSVNASANTSASCFPTWAPSTDG